MRACGEGGEHALGVRAGDDEVLGAPQRAHRSVVADPAAEERVLRAPRVGGRLDRHLHARRGTQRTRAQAAEQRAVGPAAVGHRHVDARRGERVGQGERQGMTHDLRDDGGAAQLRRGDAPEAAGREQHERRDLVRDELGQRGRHGATEGMADEREVVDAQAVDAVGEILRVGGQLGTRRALGETHARQVKRDDRSVRAGDERLPAGRAVHQPVHEHERAPAAGTLPVGQQAAVGQD
jgi:hypothetical protein